MTEEKEAARTRLAEWESALSGQALPGWEDFPALPLYMDQVIYLLNGYLSPFPGSAREEKGVTPAMINNYVKMKLVPAPVKKRYERAHLSCLVMVFVLKQSMSTGDIKRLLPAGMEPEEIRALYTAFVETERATRLAFLQAAREAAEPVLRQDGPPVRRLVFQAAVTAGLYMRLTEQALPPGDEQASRPGP